MMSGFLGSVVVGEFFSGRIRFLVLAIGFLFLFIFIREKGIVTMSLFFLKKLLFSERGFLMKSDTERGMLMELGV